VKGMSTRNFSSALKAQGIKHGVREVERSHYVDENGEIREDRMLWREDRRHSENKCMQRVASVFVWLRCLPEDPDDVLTVKHYLRLVQWLVLLCDMSAGIVAVVTFSDVTYCCGKPILDIAGGSIPWKETIRYSTYVYLAMVFLEIYPVVRKGFPFNIVNPLVGFAITFAMFFDDSKTEALIMWGIESAGVFSEYFLYRLKIRDVANNAKLIKEVGRQTKHGRAPKEGEDPAIAARELTQMRQKYYQLKQEELTDHTLLWYLGMGCYANGILSLIVLTLILTISQSGGLCVDDFDLPNPFDMDQLGRCSLCKEVLGVCEICTDVKEQCYYPYS
jgi:hypothetical protein